jgi:DNA polymerase-3 subunit gamma/tau
MRDALSLTDQAIAFGGGKVEEAAVRQMLGSADRSHVVRLIEALAQGDGKTVVETADAVRTLGLSAASTLEEMSAVLQRMAVVQAVPSATDAGDDEGAEIARLAALMPSDETQLLYSMCLHGRAELGLAPDEYAALTMVLLRLLAFQAPPAEKKTLNTTRSPQRVPQDLAEAPASLPNAGRLPVAAPPLPQSQGTARGDGFAAAPPGHVLPVFDPPVARPAGRVGGGPSNGRPATEVVGVPVRQQSESPREAATLAAAVVPTEEGDFWYRVVSDLVAQESITALARELALQSQLLGRDEGHWMLRVERESLNQPASRERLQNALAASGHAVELGVEVGAVADSPARRNAAVAAEKQRAAEAIIQGDPFVQAMMRDFGAKIVPGSIKHVSN